MYKHILIPTDGSELSGRAVHAGIDLASAMKARVTLVTSSPPFHVFATEPMMVTDTPQKYAEDAERRAADRLKEGEEYARTMGVAAAARHVYAEHPFEAIIDTARKGDCDLVCMASHGRKGMAGLLMGSETNKVLTHSKVPVLVCR
jgi:nucleotide-binding universal stress UspA family protein